MHSTLEWTHYLESAWSLCVEGKISTMQCWVKTESSERMLMCLFTLRQFIWPMGALFCIYVILEEKYTNKLKLWIAWSPFIKTNSYVSMQIHACILLHVHRRCLLLCVHMCTCLCKDADRSPCVYMWHVPMQGHIHRCASGWLGRCVLGYRSFEL